MQVHESAEIFGYRSRGIDTLTILLLAWLHQHRISIRLSIVTAIRWAFFRCCYRERFTSVSLEALFVVKMWHMRAGRLCLRETLGLSCLA